jgi:membrane associated rhomboid family serine protease
MIPLRDNVARHRLSPVNTLLIAANVAVFVHEVSLGPHLDAFIARYAMVPALVARAHLHGGLWDTRGRLWPPLTVITSMFIHGGLGHIAGNMLYLFIFGPAIEERTGPAHYLSFYLLSGIASAAATVVMAPQSTVPVIGASGAIAGVLGAYFILYPRGSILTFFPPFFFRLPAVLYLIVWFAAQLFSGIAGGTAGSLGGGVAWWAHVGGFLFGVAAGPIAVREPERRRVARR